MDDGLKFLLLMGGVLIVARVVALILGPQTQKPVEPKSDCPSHKWSYHPVTNKLTCTECNYESGTHKTQHGEY